MFCFCFNDDLSNSNPFLLTRNLRRILHNDYYWQSGGSKFDGPSNLWSARIFSELKKDLIVSSRKREVCKDWGFERSNFTRSKVFFHKIKFRCSDQFTIFDLDHKIESLIIFDILINLPFSNWISRSQL
jgi:hypothetical protein